MKLENVRIMFPSVFKKGTYEGKETKYECTFILDKEKHAPQIAEIQADIQRRVDELKVKKLGDDRVCLKDGDDSEYDNLHGTFTIKAGNKNRPLILDRDKTPLQEEDGKIYGGCYVNAMIDLWTQNNGYGKRINANLNGMQFFTDGEPFGDTSTANESDFEMFSD
jgi:hypothetical protein